MTSALIEFTDKFLFKPDAYAFKLTTKFCNFVHYGLLINVVK
jgi:hypothetical protein